MRLMAYCGDGSYEATRKIWARHASDESCLQSCPPVTAAEFMPWWLQAFNVVYLDLHGDVNNPYLYGFDANRELTRALHVDTVRKARMEGTIVFATTCYLDRTPFLDAFLRAGAVVIGGSGENFSGKRLVTGAARLFDYFLPVWDCPTEFALKVAKQRLRNDLWQRWRYRKDTEDALKFKVWRNDAIQV